MQVYIYVIILAGLVLWFWPFVPAHQQTAPAATVDRRSRWGVLLQMIAITVIWQGKFWLTPKPLWRVVTCACLFAVAIALSWSSSRALQGQLRIDAALGSDHHLVRSGPYAMVRNPIYTSMLLVLLAMAVVVATWKLFAVALAIFIAGTEIRVRTEEKLLSSRFGEEFQTYKRGVPAYLPFL